MLPQDKKKDQEISLTKCVLALPVKRNQSSYFQRL